MANKATRVGTLENAILNMIEKWLNAGPTWQCPNRECKHKQDVPQPEAVLQ